MYVVVAAPCLLYVLYCRALFGVCWLLLLLCVVCGLRFVELFVVIVVVCCLLPLLVSVVCWLRFEMV